MAATGFEVTSFVLGLILGGLLTLGVCFPRVGRIFARTLAVVLLAGGGGMLTWVSYGLLREEAWTAIVWGPIRIAQTSDAFGWSVGLLIAGIAALAFSFNRPSV